MKRMLTVSGAMMAAMLLAAPVQAAPPDDTPVKATPDPFETADLPGCFGNLNATFNHDSGIQDHGRDSKGPGFYFRDGQAFKEARDATRQAFCGAE